MSKQNQDIQDIYGLDMENDLEQDDYGSEQEEHDYMSDKEYQEQMRKQNEAQAKVNEINEDEDLKNAFSNLNHQKEVDENIKDKEETILEMTSPKEKRDFLENSLNGVNTNEKLNDSLDYLDALDETNRLIDEKEKIIEDMKNKENHSEKKENENNNKQENHQEKFDEKLNEKVNESYENLLKQHEAELERLKQEREALEQNFDKSIENLLNSKDLSDVLRALQEMDKAFALMLKQSFDEVREKERQREERIEQALQSGEMKEVAKDLVRELHTKTKEVGEGINVMNKEQESYISLNRMLNRDFSDYKDVERLERFYENIDKELPHFKENYPKIYKKGQNTLKSAKEQFMNKTNQQSRSM